ncbi:hypothetical protein ACK249_003678 [Pseudomonas aeruginosa]
MTTEKEVFATENPQWGFWGTISHESKRGVSAADAWSIAMRIVIESTQQPAEVVRTFLDSKDGRYFADEVSTFLHQGQGLPEAIEAAAKRWMVPANKSVVFSHLLDGVTYLAACVMEHAPSGTAKATAHHSPLKD